METYIDDVAGDWIADIKGEPVKPSGTNNSSSDVTLPGAFMRASDVRVYCMTDAGQDAFQKGLPTNKMKEGTHYYLIRMIPYRPTPENFFGQVREQEKNPRTDINRTYKQAPARIKH